MIITEGAGASGETVESTLSDIFQTLTRAKSRLPRAVYIYINFGSTLTAFRAARVCERFGVALSFTFMGSAINVSPQGLLPGLPYTDLSHLDPGSITYRSLYNEGLKVCTDMSGMPVLSRCSCGDVGDSLDNPEHYFMLLVLENLLLRIPLHREDLMRFYCDREFLQKLVEEIKRTEALSTMELRNTDGERILDVVARQQDSLERGDHGTGPVPY